MKGKVYIDGETYEFLKFTRGKVRRFSIYKNTFLEKNIDNAEKEEKPTKLPAEVLELDDELDELDELEDDSDDQYTNLVKGSVLDGIDLDDFEDDDFIEELEIPIEEDTKAYVVEDGKQLVYDLIKYKEPVYSRSVDESEITDDERYYYYTNSNKQRFKDKVVSYNFVKKEFGKRSTRDMVSDEINRIIFAVNSGEQITEEALNTTRNSAGKFITIIDTEYENKGVKYTSSMRPDKGTVYRIETVGEDGIAEILFDISRSDKLQLNQPYETVPYKESESSGKSKYNMQNFNLDTARILDLPPKEYFEEIYNLPDFDKVDYQIIDTKEKLDKMCEEIYALGKDRVLSVDCETTGLKFYKFIPDEMKDKLVTVSISWNPGMSRIIPLRMRYCRNVELKYAISKLKPILETYPILAQNGAADVRFLIEDGIELNLVEDLMHLMKHLMPYLAIDETGKRKKSNSSLGRSLDVPVKRVTGYDMIDLKKDVFDKRKISFDFSLLNEEYMIIYGCPDTDLLLRAWTVMRPKLEPKQEFSYRQTVIFSKNLALLATYPGIAINKEIILEGEATVRKDTEILKNLIYEISGETEETLSITSVDQLRVYIYGVLGVEVTEQTRRTKGGELSVDADVIEALAKEQLDVPVDTFKEDIMSSDGKTVLIKKEKLNKSKYPFCLALLEYRTLYKELTAYFVRLTEGSINDIYNPDYRIGVTQTWRTTEGVQTTKGNLKYGLGTYDPDEYYMFGFDFSSEELRLAANQSTDNNLIDMLKDPEVDIHSAAASELFNIPIYKVDKGKRAEAKVCNFGIIYGMGPSTLAKNLYGTDYPNEKQLSDTKKTFDLYNKKYGKMISELHKSMDFLNKHGYLYNKLGYKVIYDEVLDVKDFESQVFSNKTKTPPKVNLDPNLVDKFGWKLKNKAGNYPVQSWGGGLLMLLVNRFVERLKKEGIYGKVYIPICVHDEVDFIVHKDVHPGLILKLVYETFSIDMEKMLKKNACPLYIGCGYGMTWGEVHGDEAEIPVRLQQILIKEYEDGVLPHIKSREIPAYFIKRIENYIVDRLVAILEDEVESKVYDTGKATDKLIPQMFVLKRMDGISKVRYKDGSINHCKVINFVCDRLDLPDDYFTIVKSESTIDKEKDVDPDNELVDFNSTLDVQIHPRAQYMYVDCYSTILLDLTGLSSDVVKKLLSYFNEYKETPNKYGEYDGANLVLRYGGKVVKTETYIEGLPINSSKHIENIINGFDILDEAEETNMELYKDEDGYYLDLTKCKQEEMNDLVKKALKVLINNKLLIANKDGVNSNSLGDLGFSKLLFKTPDKTVDKNLIIRNMSIKKADEINSLLKFK